MKPLASVTWAALTLSLVFASFHSACLAEASSTNSSTLATHHPGPETLEQCPNGFNDPSLGQQHVEVWKWKDHGNQLIQFLPRAGASFLFH
ncbi:transmembrane protein 213 isoform X3 [Choloepus didactylus]|uniref:transmembrane protein 213 isoform X3 n=1 Tax=Choloepus didactylus TaxID=27675 RepID=UPI00189DA176|nr:transmembrane protein 213 isoform X3 [Choloepus didactylus]